MNVNYVLKKVLLSTILIATLAFAAKSNDLQPDSTFRVQGFDSEVNTHYDWQTNAGARTLTHVWDDGTVNFAYMRYYNNYRGTGITTYNAATNSWSHTAGIVETIPSGWGSIAQYGTNGIVVASHTATDCRVYIINDKDNVQPYSLTETSILDNTYQPAWPNVMTSGANRNIIHVIACARTDNTPTGLYNQPLYFRSQDGGQTWDKQNVVIPYTGNDYCGAWGSDRCYWMETTDDNCLALVVNNSMSDGMVIYSYDNGETWQRKVFYKHPDPFNLHDENIYYPRYTSCQWDSQHRLHVLYELNYVGAGSTNDYGPEIGGVAYWNEYLPYNINGTTQSAIVGNLVPGQPFVMDKDYLYNDIQASWWARELCFGEAASHEMWPEFMGYLPPVDYDGNPVDPYNLPLLSVYVHDTRTHGNYNCGMCAFPVLCMVPGTDYMVAVWCAMDAMSYCTGDEVNGISYWCYYNLFASCSTDGGYTWSNQIALTDHVVYFGGGYGEAYELVYPQAAIVNNKLVIAVQLDGKPGAYVLNSEYCDGDNIAIRYAFKTFDLSELFGINPQDVGENYNGGFSIYPNPADNIIYIESTNEVNCYEIYTTTGQLVYKGNNCQKKLEIDVKGLPSGTYFVRLLSDDKVCTKKFVKN